MACVKAYIEKMMWREDIQFCDSKMWRKRHSILQFKKIDTDSTKVFMSVKDKDFF